MALFDFHAFLSLLISSQPYLSLKCCLKFQSTSLNWLKDQRVFIGWWVLGGKYMRTQNLGLRNLRPVRLLELSLTIWASLTNTQLLKLVLVNTLGPVHLLLLQFEQILDALAMQVCFNSGIFQLSFLCLLFYFYFLFFMELLCERLWGISLRWKFWS